MMKNKSRYGTISKLFEAAKKFYRRRGKTIQKRRYFI
jgi:hypothetical protein